MKMKRHYSGVFLIVGCWSQLVGGYDPSPLCPVAKSDRGDGGDMGRTIQGLEDLHHGFPVDRVGQRHHGFAFETVTGTPAITWGDFEGVLPSHLLMLDTVALNFLGITLVDGLYRSSYHLTPASNRCLVYATLVRTSFGINFRPFLNML